MFQSNDHAELLAELGAATDALSLLHVCKTFAESRGVTNLIVGLLQADGEGQLGASALVEALPLELSMASLKRRHANYTPTILELLGAGAPYDSDAPPAQTYRRDFERIWDDHLQFEHCAYFYTVPVAERGQVRGWAGFFSDRRFETPDTKIALEMMTHAAYERALAMSLLPLAKSPLTRRQSDALLYCALGKSDWEIGEILGISEATAHEHIEAAKHRLGVHTRIQAVVAAVQRGWIKP